MQEGEARLVAHFEQSFEHFKHTYTYFQTVFHPHLYQKHSNNITQTFLPNTLWNSCVFLLRAWLSALFYPFFKWSQTRLLYIEIIEQWYRLQCNNFHIYIYIYICMYVCMCTITIFNMIYSMNMINWVQLIYAFRIHINHLFLETFYEKLKNLSKEMITFSFFHKKFSKIVY